jgi:serine/threonine-protein kinase
VHGLDSLPLLPTASDPAKVSKPTEAELSSAEARGPDAVQELTLRFPSDPAVFRAAVRANAAAKRTLDAMKGVDRLIALDPRAVDDAEIGDAVTAAAQGNGEGVEEAVSLLEGPFGTKGADVLFELSTSKGLSSKTAQRINQALSQPDVRAHASPALLVALDLRAATRCEARKGVLPRAKEIGDARALPLLRPLLAAKGCGFLKLGDCQPCLHRDDSLKTTIASIEERVGK